MVKKIALLSSLLMFCFFLQAQDKKIENPVNHSQEIEQLLNRVNEVQLSLKTLHVDFVQTNRFKMLEKPQVLKGFLTIQKPDTALYEYRSPIVRYFLVKDGNLLVYFPDEKKVIIQDIRRHQGTIIRYLGVAQPFNELRKSFNVKWIGKEDSIIHIELIPKKFRIKRKITVMHFWIDESISMPIAFEIVQKDGDSTKFEFSKWKKNPKLGKKAFEVDIPEGVKVQKHLWGLGDTFTD